MLTASCHPMSGRLWSYCHVQVCTLPLLPLFGAGWINGYNIVNIFVWSITQKNENLEIKPFLKTGAGLPFPLLFPLPLLIMPDICRVEKRDRKLKFFPWRRMLEESLLGITVDELQHFSGLYQQRPKVWGRSGSPLHPVLSHPERIVFKIAETGEERNGGNSFLTS